MPPRIGATGKGPTYVSRIEGAMPATDAATIDTVLKFSGTFLNLVTAMIIVFGLLVVALSFRGSQEKD